MNGLDFIGEIKKKHQQKISVNSSLILERKGKEVTFSNKDEKNMYQILKH